MKIELRFGYIPNCLDQMKGMLYKTIDAKNAENRAVSPVDLIEIIISRRFIKIEPVGDGIDPSQEEKECIYRILRKNDFSKCAVLYSLLYELIKGRTGKYSENYNSDEQVDRISWAVQSFTHSLFWGCEIDHIFYNTEIYSGKDFEDSTVRIGDAYVFEIEGGTNRKNLTEFLRVTSDRLDRHAHKNMYNTIFKDRAAYSYSRIEYSNMFSLKNLYSVYFLYKEKYFLAIDFGMELVYRHEEVFRRILLDVEDSLSKNNCFFNVDPSTYGITEEELAIFLSLIKHSEQIAKEASVYLLSSDIVNYMACNFKKLVHLRTGLKINKKDMLSTIIAIYPDIMLVAKKNKHNLIDKYRNLSNYYINPNKKDKKQNPYISKIVRMFGLYHQSIDCINVGRIIENKYIAQIKSIISLARYKIRQRHIRTLDSTQRQYIKNTLEKEFTITDEEIEIGMKASKSILEDIKERIMGIIIVYIIGTILLSLTALSIIESDKVTDDE